jgi:hypothetical protein
MAKRMVSSALGVKLVTSKEEREKEKNLLKEARGIFCRLNSR